MNGAAGLFIELPTVGGQYPQCPLSSGNSEHPIRAAKQRQPAAGRCQLKAGGYRPMSDIDRDQYLIQKEPYYRPVHN